MKYTLVYRNKLINAHAMRQSKCSVDGATSVAVVMNFVVDTRCEPTVEIRVHGNNVSVPHLC